MEVVKDRIQSYVINEVLDLSGLELYEFPEIPWHISRVNLSNNFISKVSQIPKTIKSLDLSRNRIKDISFEEKSKLIFLNLRENCLEVLDVKNIDK
jgi:Leucine-rich repeat (LRR) protein